jgi:hypothetical protein
MSIGQLAERIRREMIPLRKPFSYYFTDLPLTEEDIREYLEEPIAALPPSIVSILPKMSILLVPYLERAKEKGKPGEYVRKDKPHADRLSWISCLLSKEEAVVAFALKDQEVADYHYHLYHVIADLVAAEWSEPARRQYMGLLREELTSKVHGEVDEASWHLKQQLVRRQTNTHRETKLFRDYTRQSFSDTLTLYLHGLCCDIDVEPGPRQLASRYLRKRLETIRQLYPPPENYSLFPDEVRHPARDVAR